ncbi:MAG: tetratricopeptide repeat protein, partial [Phycisphaerae bacterium]
PWASPEQARGLTRDIDVRTDTYSLGVILYQLLTRRFPYQVVGNMQEVLQNICNAEPTRPRTICRQINDEIETIILKCLSKDRERRYQTAGELARDTRRYLAGEPIEAKRDSGWYVLRKTMKRHKAPVAFAGIFVLLSVISGITFSVLFRQASAAEQRASHSRTVLTDMVNLMELLEPGHAGDHDKLQAFIEQLKDDPLADPEVEALIYEKIGKVYKGWSDYAEAAPHLEKSLAIRQDIYEEPDARIAQGLHDLGSLYWFQGLYEQAKDYYQQALEMRRQLFEEPNEAVASTLNDLAACYDKVGDYETFDAFFDESLQMRLALLEDGQESEDIASMINNRGASLYRRGQYAEAAQQFQRSLSMMRKFRDDDDILIIRTKHNLARCLTEAGDLAQARILLFNVLAKKKERLGDEHDSVARTLHALALVKYLQDDLGPAERYCRQALDIRRSKLGSSHRATAISRHLLGLIELARGDVHAATESAEQALKVYRQGLGDDHWRVADAQSLLGDCLARQGQWAEAQDMLVPSYERLSVSLGAKQWRSVQALNRVIELYDAWGKLDEAARYRELLEEAESDDDQAEPGQP